MDITPLLLFLHLVSVTAWVGGMFFAYVCLRPAAAEVLDPPLRLTLWKRVFDGFFPAVWAAVSLILLSGFAMLIRVGFGAAPVHWHLMFLLGLVMAAIFGTVVMGPFRQLTDAVNHSDWPAAGAALGRIRRLVGLNLSLGFITIGIATLGRWL